MSEHRFAPGDLALTLVDLPPVMAGSVVELDCHIEAGDLIDTPSGTLQANGNGWICIHPLVPGKCAYADASLMPLRGDHFLPLTKANEVPA